MSKSMEAEHVKQQRGIKVTNGIKVATQLTLK